MGEVIITQFIFLNDGFKDDFLEFESRVLPLLLEHNGKLLYRIRPAKETYIYPVTGELPYEIHILTFDSDEDLEKYKNDPERAKYIHLAERSIKKIIMLKSQDIYGR